MKHKHADLIKAWADGAIIQYRNNSNWYILKSPVWDVDGEYRTSIGEVEGKPVFVDDLIWHPHYGCAQRAWEGIFTARAKEPANEWSWNPPKPSTITVELLREDVGRVLHCLDLYEVPIAITRAKDAFREALK